MKIKAKHTRSLAQDLLEVAKKAERLGRESDNLSPMQLHEAVGDLMFDARAALKKAGVL